MKIEINITKDNKDRILKLLDELVDAESSTSEEAGKIRINESKEGHRAEKEEYKGYAKYMDKPSGYIDKLFAPASIESSEFGLGKNFLFNSFFAAKAMLRVITNLTNEERKPPEQDKVLDTFSKATKARGLQKYNGFPKNRENEKHEGSSVNKLFYSILLPLSQMDMLKLKDNNTSLTKHGLEFSMLTNPKLDDNKDELLSEDEINYLIDYLKEIDIHGYKEYTFLKRIVDFIKEKSAYGKTPVYQDLVDFIKRDERFVDYIYKTSKFGKNGLPKESRDFLNKLQRTAQAVVASRIALLRELRVIEDRRNSYRIIKDVFG